ncbi:MAG: SDR family NAD(P)-dependent oxidoreductase [Planctomycetes bacterium]|nr:SDR family NAD(P)-dependent oxidoreductase [Planctomycetota bacterium]
MSTSANPQQTVAFPEGAIAVVGTACHLPGARNAAEFWNNLRNGVESVHFFTDEELLAAGVPAARLTDPNYVKASPTLDQVAGFDPGFWGISPKDAAIMDPQHRHFLECAYEALEDAGHDSQRFDGTIGVFGGCGANSYLMFNLLTNPQLVDSVGMFLLRHTNNDKDFLTTFTSYKMELEGPSVGIQTACSTSLVAIHVAAQHLLNGECDMALAGGSTIEIPHQAGYRSEQGDILSPDGHCRPFDASSAGTVFGSGAGMVVLRCLEDAIADGDTIRAVLRGSAVNNDGARKAGYLAPSVDGQAHAVAEALAVADVPADSISYLETHGTGTPVGDPIEVAGLTQAFRETTDGTGFCAIGSCKSNIGHADTAAGVASFLKVVEALQHEQLPPSLFFDQPNPLIEFDASPFYVNAKLQAWPRSEQPRRAGVNSLGVGGTNAHAILEEAPLQQSDEATRSMQILPLSAKTRTALDAMCERLADALEQQAEVKLADVAFTLQQGRREMEHRRTITCSSVAEAIALLREHKPPHVRQGQLNDRLGQRSLAFLLPGGGAQYAQMARDLYDKEASFRATLDRGFDILAQQHDVDLRPILLAEATDEIRTQLERPSIQLPAIFLVEVALGELLMRWGLQPDALLGHSLGENSAAYLAGVFPFEGGLGLVALRGKLFESLPPGGMVSVAMPASEVEPLLSEQLVIGVHNTPQQCVVSGPPQALQELHSVLEEHGMDWCPVKIDCAAHSPMLEPILQQFGDYIRGLELQAPHIPMVSNYTGQWLTDQEATDPEYWVKHLRHPVLFSDGTALLLQDKARVMLEVGPGKGLASLARQHPNASSNHVFLSAMRHRDEKSDDLDFLLGVVGQLWNIGIAPDWQGLHGSDKRLRIPLPTYPFERQDYWIEAGAPQAEQSAAQNAFEQLESLDDWFSQESWSGVICPTLDLAALKQPQRWLLFLDRLGLGGALAARLRAAGQEVITVREGDTYYRFDEQEFALSPEAGREDYDSLFSALESADHLPDRIVHLWTVTGAQDARPGSSMFHHNKERGFFSLFFLGQALGELENPPKIQLDVFSNGLHKVKAKDVVLPEKAMLLGPVRVIPREFSFLDTRNIDLDFATRDDKDHHGKSELLMALLASPSDHQLLAERDGQLFAPVAEKLSLPSAEDSAMALPRNGVVLITGGLGGLGLTMAEFFAQSAGARLVLIGRSPFPQESEWQSWLGAHASADPTSQKIHRLMALKELGSEIMVKQADVANIEDMQQVLTEAEQRFGAVDGVVHAAGILEDGVIQRRTPEAAERVFTPKVHGTMVLHDLLHESPLKFFLLCSSTSVALGPAGQVDYVAANAFLNAFAASHKGKDPFAMTALNWGIWSDVGMAQELAARLHNSGPVPGERLRLDGPWFRQRIDVSAIEKMWRGHLDAKHCWLLDEHRLQNGMAVMPGTAYLEAALVALQDWQGGTSAVLSDVEFLEPCELADDSPRELCIGIKQREKGFDFEVRSHPSDNSDGWHRHAKGHLSLEPLPTATPIDFSALEQGALERFQRARGASLPDPQDRFVAFGPRFKTHKSIGYDHNQAFAHLSLDESFHEDFDSHPLHPALLDIATGVGMELLAGYDSDESMFVPLSYGRVEVHAPLQADLLCRLSIPTGQTAEQDVVSFHVDICDSSGAILVGVRDFQMRRLSANSAFAGLHNLALHAHKQDTPAERAFLDSLKAGIDAASGMQALQRVLSHATPATITISSMDMAKLNAVQSEAMEHMGDMPSVKFQRPNLSSEFEAPADSLEQQLADWWEELLGIEKVGVMDDFFEVGGHSLVAVRLFARIKKKWNLDYPLSLLFEAPTIRLCADMLRSEMAHKQEADESSAPQEGGRRKRSLYLVPLNDVRGKTKPPFFLVAGMFGNVLNLRHLATHLGEDQPVYAIQARGLHGDDRPHRRFEDMARDYLEEVRKIQPQGPYLIGGFSGGGLSAFEMAQQLHAAGEETAALIMLDTPIPQPPSANLLERVFIQLARIRRGGLKHILQWPQKRIAWEFEKRRLAQSADEEALAPAEFRSELIREGFEEALQTYQIRPYRGRLTIFRPPLDRTFVLPGGRLADEYREIQDPNNHWDPYAPDGIDCFEVPGDHDSMVLEPHVRVLGSKIFQVLSKAHQASQDQGNG